jgi:methanogenic corrinoid protein MtbC1
MEYFDKKDKDSCVHFAMTGITNGLFTLPQLYEEVLTPALFSIDLCQGEDKGCIWDEHVKTGIVKTVIEALYPDVIKSKSKVEPLKIKVLLACPERELHDVGLRMMSDLFAIEGFDPVFIGANTPRDQVSIAIQIEKPKYVAISITDHYHLSEAKKLIEEIRKDHGNGISIILGGRAIKNNMTLFQNLDGDLFMDSYEDIIRLKEGELS